MRSVTYLGMIFSVVALTILPSRGMAKDPFPTTRPILPHYPKSERLGKKPAAPKLRSRCDWHQPWATESMKGGFRGWTLYDPEIVCLRSKLPAMSPGNQTAVATVIHFFLSLLRKDQTFLQVLSPAMKKSVRTKMIKRILKASQGLKRFSISAKISAERSRHHNAGFAKNMAFAGKKFFGHFDVMFFLEGNTAADDMLVFVEKRKKLWYIKGLIAKFAIFLVKQK